MKEVYHGSITIVKSPLCYVGRDDLDFGKGFYLTDIYEQAQRWAIRQKEEKEGTPIVNIYEFDIETVKSNYKYLSFEEYNEEWLSFIVRNRNGEKQWENYDVIEGGIANDRVILTVNMYMMGLMSADVALQRLAQHKPNNQICILNQEIVDKYLIFKKSEIVTL